MCILKYCIDILQVSEVAKGKTEANLNLVVAKDELNRIQQSLANRPTSEDVTEASGKFFLILIPV